MDLSLECPNSEELKALAVGKASGRTTARLRSHIEHCQACRGRMEHVIGQTLATPIQSPRADPYATLAGGKSAPVSSEYAFLSPPLEPDEIGRLDNYRVLRVLGKGGMGVVFQAEDIKLGRSVALKVMLPELKYDPDSGQRFLREARALADIKHDHLVTIYTVETGDVHYFVMELLEGESLESWMHRTPSPEVGEIIRLGREIAAGLCAIHERDLIHRDIKPANLWLEGPRRRVKILDLGLARSVGPATSLTVTGVVMGTPDYMSPEQARGSPVDARTDLFSLGCVLYTLCTHRKPFEGTNVSAVLMSLASETPPSVFSLNSRVPRPLSDLVMELLARNPRKRPSSAEEVRRRLEEMEGKPYRRPDTPAPRRQKTQKALDDLQEDSRDSHTEPLGLHVRFAKPRAPTSSGWKNVLSWSAVLSAFASLGIAIALVMAMRPPRGPLKPIDPPEGEKTYLSDMKATASEHWPFQKGPDGPKKEMKRKGGKEPPPGEDMDWPPQKGFDGPKKEMKKKGDKEPPPGKEVETTVWFKGKRSPHGIFMHPPVPPFDGEPASLTYSLRKQFAIFQADVALNDGQESETPCTFRVYGDDKLLWQSKPINTFHDTQKCTIAVKDVDALKIAVTCDGHPRGAHAIWIEPFLTK